jgi:hypothetical protein
MHGESGRQVRRAAGRGGGAETLGCPKLEVRRKRGDSARIMKPGWAVTDILAEPWCS